MREMQSFPKEFLMRSMSVLNTDDSERDLEANRQWKPSDLPHPLEVDPVVYWRATARRISTERDMWRGLSMGAIATLVVWVLVAIAMGGK